MLDRTVRSPIQTHQAVPDDMWITRDGTQHRVVHWTGGISHAPTVVTVCGLSTPIPLASDPNATPCEGCR
ncbi:hypothetical protein [Saccharomonospora saliphila]|uniref:hypothetical protein n=1 Tax=Saccharomonospora saliphila TaxID=369829 RepID=UPI00036F04A3|nr:hypothetical protein [Saccharomonospora saliphila]